MYLKFSIVTPSYNMINYLKNCHASIIDQEGVEIEYIVVDNNSTDGTKEWLSKQKNIKKIIEKDNGMYDALNKGINIASGDIIGHLNCDEQYLENTLKYISSFFINNPKVDIVHGNILTVNKNGELNAFKKGHKLREKYILSANLYAFTCATFYRKKIFQNGSNFNTNYKSIGDKEFMLCLIKDGYHFKHIKKYLSIFIITGENLSQQTEINEKEKDKLFKQFKFNKKYILFYRFLKYFEKLVYGCYKESFPITYSIYLKGENRQLFVSNNASFRSRW